MANQGWQCPLCRVVWAPTVTSCRCQISPGSFNPAAGGVIFRKDALYPGDQKWYDLPQNGDAKAPE